jgi:methylphosphotriester-DNA--protein-cysteine methyltransferase
VVRTDGGLGGYTFGLARKEALLSLERRTAPFVGCARSKILCRTGCEAERRVPADGRVPFANLEDAAAAGYRPCAACRPD